jgi:hypothetical protein
MQLAHISEEDLILHYYGEMTAAEEQALSAHLTDCGACRAELTRLQRVLGALDEGAVPPAALPEGFERTVWARLEPNLRRTRRGWLPLMAFSPAPLALAAAVILLVAAAFFAGRVFSPATTAPASASRSPEQIRERILLVDLGDHLERSQMVLVELLSGEEGTDGHMNIAVERARAEQLVTANRLYRQTAADTGDAAVRELLDELERVLVDVAASPEELSQEELGDVRRRIDSRALLFKVRVVSSQLRERQREGLRKQEI